MIQKPLHGIGSEQVSLRVVLVAGLPHPRINGRVHKQLEHGLYVGMHCHERSQVATSRVAADGNPRCVDAQRLGVGKNPLGCHDAIVEGGRCRVLGCQAIVNSNHTAVGVACQLSTDVVVGVEVANNPTTAVIINKERCCGCCARAIQPTLHAAGFDVADFVQFNSGGCAHRQITLTGLCR